MHVILISDHDQYWTYIYTYMQFYYSSTLKLYTGQAQIWYKSNLYAGNVRIIIIACACSRTRLRYVDCGLRGKNGAQSELLRMISHYI